MALVKKWMFRYAWSLSAKRYPRRVSPVTLILEPLFSVGDWYSSRDMRLKPPPMQNSTLHEALEETFAEVRRDARLRKLSNPNCGRKFAYSSSKHPQSTECRLYCQCGVSRAPLLSSSKQRERLPRTLPLSPLGQKPLGAVVSR
jgi:hypothetical protein